jgi:hypothetical protein
VEGENFGIRRSGMDGGEATDFELDSFSFGR